MGPLHGYRIIEIGSIGPGPFCAMLLADMGADVVRIDRADDSGLPLQGPVAARVMHRNRRSAAMNLKHPEAVAALLRMCASADALLEGFRPGVMEQLGLGPEACLGANPRLVYGRMTGWGQQGPLAGSAGHDINYVALSGVLDLLGHDGEPPWPPLNIVGDMGGGGLLLAFGIVCALLEAGRSGRGQVVDAAMVDGAALMASTVDWLRATGWWSAPPGANLFDGGAHFYSVYTTRDGRHVAVGALEPQFYAELLAGLGLDPAGLPEQMDRAAWPEMKRLLQQRFSSRSREEWLQVFAGGDACVTPVLTPAEAAQHSHNVARRTFLAAGGAQQAAPAPRFSRTEPGIRLPPPAPGEHTDAVLEDFGFRAGEILALRSCAAIR